MTTILDRPVPPTRPWAGRRPPLARLEIAKTLSTRSGVALVGAASVLPVGALALVIAVDDPPPDAPIMLAFLGTLMALLLIAVGVLSSAGEWTHHTAQTTYLAVPQRHRVTAAKYAASALLGAAIAAGVVATTYAVAAVFGPADFSWARAGAAAVATVAGGAALTVVGTGIGAAIGNAPAALTGTYLVLVVGMPLLNGIAPAVSRRVDPLTALFDVIQGEAVARPVGVLAAWALVGTVAGAVVTRRRAVS